MSSGRSSSSSVRSSSNVSRSSSSQNRDINRQSATQNRQSATRSSGSASRSNGSVSRQQCSTNRSNGTASRSNGSVNRSNGNVNRQQSSPSRSNGTASRPNASVNRSNGSARPADRPSRGGANVGRSPERGAREIHGNNAIRPGTRASAPRIEPRHRDFIEHGHASLFYRRGHHHYGYRVHVLPSHYHRTRFWGYDYYICDGIYYRFWDDCYHICRPPYGIFFDRALYDLELLACDIAYYSTVHRAYSRINDNYRTIDEQNRIIAQNNATIAAQNQAMASNTAAENASYQLANRLGLFQSYASAGTDYYYDDGIFFIEDNGQYKTIVPPAGAIITELPDDYETIILEGTQYYKVDDTIYQVVISDGRAVFEVLGQLQQ